MYYSYILLSSKSHTFYSGSTVDLRKRLTLHNKGEVFSTKPYLPWKLVWYGAFITEKEARDFAIKRDDLCRMQSQARCGGCRSSTSPDLGSLFC